MWKCKDCNTQFDFPEIKRPDVGLVSCEGILGFRNMNPVKFCPECFSTHIRQQESTKAKTGQITVDA